MTLSGIDDTAALVIIDLQEGLSELPFAHSFDEVAERSGQLAKAFRQHGHPVVLVNVTGSAPGRTDAGNPAMSPPPNWADLVAHLDVQASDHLVTKQRWGAFHGTRLHDHLHQLGVTQVVITGVATSMGVESTARAAHEHGYNVVLVTDAMTDLDPVAHGNSVERIFPRLGEAATTAEVLSWLQRA